MMMDGREMWEMSWQVVLQASWPALLFVAALVVSLFVLWLTEPDD